MKQGILRIIALAMLIGIVFASCSKKDKIQAPAAGPVKITADFQASFEQSRVQYYVDDWPVFDQELTTMHQIGLAHSQQSALQPGIHKIRVVVDGVHAKDTIIDLQRDLFLGVNYNSGDIRILQSDIRWMYD